MAHLANGLIPSTSSSIGVFDQFTDANRFGKELVQKKSGQHDLVQLGGEY